MAWISEYQRWLSEEESLQNAQQVAYYFHGTGWDKKAISAMCGNMRHESSINPDMYEYGYNWEDDRGYGLVQWTPRSKYWNWSEGEGLEPRAGDSQLQRIVYERANGLQWIKTRMYDISFVEFSTNRYNWTVDKLTEAFVYNYERPANPASSLPDRKYFANRCYNELDWGARPSEPPPPTEQPTGKKQDELITLLAVGVINW